MKRDWKPGDVAMVTYGGRSEIALVNHRPEARSELQFSYVRGFDMVDDREVADSARLLVVIDPEDREQVERLRQDLINSGWTPDCQADSLDDIFREFASPTPPKPDEPLGLGAVVEDADGEVFIRTNPSGTNSWVPVDSGARAFTFPYREYDQIAAVRVLSEGVS